MAFERINEYAAEKQKLCTEHDTISDALFKEYGVNRGLRDINGKGVLTGLTRISKIVSFKDNNGVAEPCDGELWYRGYNINTLIAGLNGGFGFEKTAYLLIFGELPSDEQLAEFNDILSECRVIPSNFTRDVIMKAPSHDIMNSMTKSILTLSSYDENIASNDIDNCIRQCLMLTAVFPMLAVYGYHAYNHYENDGSMYIHRPAKYTELEARVLDIVLMLHMEHGGGNNSTFTTRVVTSSGSDTYSAIAAAMSSLKGPRHGGANLKVMQMMQDIRSHIGDPTDKSEVEAYLRKLLDGEAFDRKGLIYGMGHAVYSISDPRERVLKSYVQKLAEAKGKTTDMALYSNIEEIAPQLIAEKRRIYKGVSPNVDFYSGFVYDMLGIPVELYTPLFAIARVVGWSAHRIEELVGMGKIIRPAYKSVMEEIE